MIEKHSPAQGQALAFKTKQAQLSVATLGSKDQMTEF